MTGCPSSKTDTLQAVLLSGTVDHPGAGVGRISRPKEQSGRVVVEVVAAGITKMEPHWITGWQYPDGTRRSGPVVLGCEFAGCVRSQSAEEHGFTQGQAVLGMTGQYRKGAMTEFVSARRSADAGRFVVRRGVDLAARWSDSMAGARPPRWARARAARAHPRWRGWRRHLRDPDRSMDRGSCRRDGRGARRGSMPTARRRRRHRLRT